MRKGQTSTMYFRILSLVLFMSLFIASCTFTVRLGSYFFGEDTTELEIFTNYLEETLISMDEGSTESFRFSLKPDSKIVFLNPDSEYDYKPGPLAISRNRHLFSDVTSNFKPSSCDSNNLCICLCNQGVQRFNERHGEMITIEYSCSEYSCLSFENYVIEEEIMFEDAYPDDQDVVNPDVVDPDADTAKWTNSFGIRHDLVRDSYFYLTKKEGGVISFCFSSDNNCSPTPGGS